MSLLTLKPSSARVNIRQHYLVEECGWRVEIAINNWGRRSEAYLRDGSRYLPLGWRSQVVRAMAMGGGDAGVVQPRA
jgi:hypothetical protein